MQSRQIIFYRSEISAILDHLSINNRECINAGLTRLDDILHDLKLAFDPDSQVRQEVETLLTLVWSGDLSTIRITLTYLDVALAVL